MFPPEIVEILNAIGLPVLAVGIFIMYRALLNRTTILQSSIKDVRDVYDAMIEAMKNRYEDLASTIDRQKAFNEMYLSMVKDSNEHVENIKRWRESEVVILSKRVESLEKELDLTKERLKSLNEENSKLIVAIKSLEHQMSELELRNMGPGEAKARGK